ncbi:MAG: flavodoxin [Candidatus Thermoplasmatota archaeon]|nr:flavodoxin [Candidatus Thermoplasmatota archaeon]
MKVLVVYYSSEGNTRLIARHMAKTVNADLLEIKPLKEAKRRGLAKFIVGGGQAMMNKRPEIQPPEKDFEDYDMIFIGTPVWAWTAAPPVISYLEKANIEGKRIALFSSNEGQNGTTFEKMRRYIPENEIVGEEEFYAPLKKDKEGTLVKAVSFAYRMINQPPAAPRRDEE